MNDRFGFVLVGLVGWFFWFGLVCLRWLVFLVGFVLWFGLVRSSWILWFGLVLFCLI
jgi:hypothetical protein